MATNKQSSPTQVEAPTPVIVKGARERREYNLDGVITFIRQESNITDTTMEYLIAYFRAALEGDGVIDREEAQTLLIDLQYAYNTHGNIVHAVELLDVSGTEAALRETERIQAKRRQVAAKKQHK